MKATPQAERDAGSRLSTRFQLAGAESENADSPQALGGCLYTMFSEHVVQSYACQTLILGHTLPRPCVALIRLSLTLTVNVIRASTKE